VPVRQESRIVRGPPAASDRVAYKIDVDAALLQVRDHLLMCKLGVGVGSCYWLIGSGCPTAATFTPRERRLIRRAQDQRDCGNEYRICRVAPHELFSSTGKAGRSAPPAAAAGDTSCHEAPSCRRVRVQRLIPCFFLPLELAEPQLAFSQLIIHGTPN